MLSGKMPPETFPEVTECQGSEDSYYTKNDMYKIYPNAFLTDISGTTPSTSMSSFEKATKQVLPINTGIFINDPSCKLSMQSSLNTKNYILARYIGRIPLVFYGAKTKAGEHFKLKLTNNDLDNRAFCKEEDLNLSGGSIDNPLYI